MIVSGQLSISLGYCLSDTSEGMLIWSNLILDLHESSKLHINLSIDNQG